MNALIKEATILILPSLLVIVGLNAAILLQQLHANLPISTHVRDGHKWVYKTYENRQDNIVSRSLSKAVISDHATCTINNSKICPRGNANCPLYRRYNAPSNNLRE
ncbi:hypothetical protein MKY34_05125 [Sporosarcina sp. FSL K6-1522]|uniref:hypothetical protein n=1 Tax=Sporosarcina sp. FSL K6-1522 TaxID=2921554 RepID=UPI00315AD012